MKIDAIPVVFFNDLEYSGLMEGSFNGPSYGDAEFTLVFASDLAAELIYSYQVKYADLIKELQLVPAGVYVALNG